MLVLSLGITGCAMTPGLQTYDLPQQGSYKTDQGAELNVVPLTQNNIPAISQANSQNLAQIQTGAFDLGLLWICLFTPVDLQELKVEDEPDE